jgi:CRISPR-associated protein Cas1
MKRVDNSYPYLYLEHGNLFRKDSLILFKDKTGLETTIPTDSFVMVLCGPGVSFTSNAISHLCNTECYLTISSSAEIPKCFLTTFPKIGNPVNSIKQYKISCNRNIRFATAKEILKLRFADQNFKNIKSLNELMLKEARLTKKIYKNIFGSEFIRNYESDSDNTNKKINIASNAIYNYCGCIIHLMGFSPHIGFLHGVKRNAFVFDLSEIFKTEKFYKIINEKENIGDLLKTINIFMQERKPLLLKFLENVSD